MNPSKIHNPKSPMARLAVLALLLAGALGSQAETTNAPANAPTRLSYDSFRMVSDRNIFNPNRFARSSGRTQRSSSQPVSRVESISLVGIMAYEKGIYAFFDGTKADYRHALQPGATIGEYQVVQVTPEHVQLRHGTNTYDLKVGMQMRREDEGDWFLSEGGDANSRRRVATGRTWNRSGSPAGQANGEEMPSEDGGPEVVVVNSGETEEANGAPATNAAEGEAPNGEPAQAENAATSGVTDPVLLRLIQRRQQMNR